MTLVRLRLIMGAALALAAFTVLWRFQPEWPQLPSSLSSPVTTGLVQDLVLVAAWVSGGLVVLVLLVRSLLARHAHAPRPSQALRPGGPAPRHRSLAHAGLADGSSRPAFAPPFSLVPRAHPSHVREDSNMREHRRAETARPSIALLGPLEIRATEPRSRGLRSKTQQLLVYLALHPKGATTDELIAAVLPGAPDDRARRRVWRSISEVRSELGDVLPRSGDHYLLDRTAVAVDIDELDFLLAQANAESDAARERLLERAVALVRGEPLAGTDYPWAAGEVRHLRAKVVDLLHELGQIWLAHDNATGALAAAERAIALDAENESAHRLAMRAEAGLGLREAIVVRYERLCQELDAGFGLEPERDTRLLYRRLLSQDPRSDEASVSETREPLRRSPPLPQMPSPANPRAHRT
jgi:DNA-binding SARP family transcriptional activator